MRYAKLRRTLQMFLLFSLCAGHSAAQEPSAQANQSAAAAKHSRIVRDPVTGRLFQQRLVDASVPVTRWEPKQIQQTVYQPRYVTTNVAAHQTIYVPRTQQVLHQRIVGRWNPFRPTAMQYQYRPVTSWVPQTQTVNVPVTTQQWAKTQQTATAWEPVQRIEKTQQLVSTEIPQPNIALASASRPPLFRLPILPPQRPQPIRRAVENVARAMQPSSASPVLRPASLASNPTGQRNYSAPLQTASTRSSSFARGSSESGMAATVLR